MGNVVESFSLSGSYMWFLFCNDWCSSSGKKSVMSYWLQKCLMKCLVHQADCIRLLQWSINKMFQMKQMKIPKNTKFFVFFTSRSQFWFVDVMWHCHLWLPGWHLPEATRAGVTGLRQRWQEVAGAPAPAPTEQPKITSPRAQAMIWAPLFMVGWWYSGRGQCCEAHSQKFSSGN